jgi:signal transduction histidine kinase
MGFVEDAQAWLTRGGEGQLPADFDLEGRRRALHDALSKLPPEELEDEILEWMGRDALERVVREILGRTRAAVGNERTLRSLYPVIDATLRAMATDLTTGPTTLRPIDQKLAERIAQAMVDVSASIGDWCAALGFSDGSGKPTPLGQVFCRLVGRDALQFALEVEVRRSTGRQDELRASRSILEQLSSEEGLIFDEDLNPRGWSYPRETAQRLQELGLATHDADDTEDRYRVDADLRPMLDLVLAPAPNPIRSLASALLDAERGLISTTVTGSAPSSESAYAANVVHEMRNLMLPLEHSLARLWSALERPTGPDRDAVRAIRERVDAATSRLSGFARESAQFARFLEPEDFGLRDIIREATTATEIDRNGRIKVESSVDAGRINGPRMQWVLAFTNLLRNAAQVRDGNGQVQISSTWDVAGKLHIYVDDDGPGVPEEYRESIFDEGVSRRGGSGLGLSQVRSCLRASSGTVVCEKSPLGGARLHMHVPARPQ